MPIYEYLCKKCGEFEMTQRITERPLTRCPRCKAKVTKLMSSTSFQLKGSGWYVTDYARKGGASTHEKSEGKSESKGEASASSSSSESKSTTTETKRSTEKGGSTETKGSSKNAAAA